MMTGTASSVVQPSVKSSSYKKPIITCPICHHTLISAYNLRRHLQRKHANEADLVCLPTTRKRCINCGICGQIFTSVSKLCNHATLCHDLGAFINENRFGSEEEFRNWLRNVEHEGNFRFRTPRGRSGKWRAFLCSKSGLKRPSTTEGTKTRGRRTNNALRVGFFCTTFVYAQFLASGEVVVKSCLRHYGHDAHDHSDVCYQNHPYLRDEDFLNDAAYAAMILPAEDDLATNAKKETKIEEDEKISEELEGVEEEENDDFSATAAALFAGWNGEASVCAPVEENDQSTSTGNNYQANDNNHNFDSSPDFLEDNRKEAKLALFSLVESSWRWTDEDCEQILNFAQTFQSSLSNGKKNLMPKKRKIKEVISSLLNTKSRENCKKQNNIA